MTSYIHDIRDKSMMSWVVVVCDDPLGFEFDDNDLRFDESDLRSSVMKSPIFLQEYIFTSVISLSRPGDLISELLYGMQRRSQPILHAASKCGRARWRP